MTTREDLARINSSATAAANLPALIPPRSLSDEPGALRFFNAVQAHLQARQGARSPYERAATMRDLEQLAKASGYAMQVGSSGTSAAFTPAPAGSSASTTLEAFADRLRTTKLYRDLVTRLDDPGRFADLPDMVQQLLLTPLSQIAQERGADVQRLEKKIQDATHSIATNMTEVTAAFARNTAGFRQLEYAYANIDRAVSGSVTTVNARLDDFGGGGASVEVAMTAIADRATGLEAQYTMKVNAGGAFAAIGLGATSPVAGTGDSHIIFVANNFAFVRPTDVIGTGTGQVDPTNPGASRIPFGIDSDDVIYLNGTVRITPNGRPIEAQNARAFYTGGAWVDGHANSALAALTGSAVKNIGDTVTISNGSSFWEERYWSGSAWVNPGVIINGNLLVGGTISGVNINLSGSARFNGTYTPGTGNTTALVVNDALGNIDGIYAVTSAGSGVGVTGQATGTGVGSGIGVLGLAASIGTGVRGNAAGAGVGVFGQAASGGFGVVGSNTGSGAAVRAVGDISGTANAIIAGQVRGGGTPNTDAAVIGYGTGVLHGGRFHNVLGRAGFIASGSSGLNWNFYSDGTGAGYGPFTGAHDALILKDTPAPTVGDIVVDVRCLRRADVSNTLFEVALSTEPCQKAAIGVAVMPPVPFDAAHAPCALRQWIDVWDEAGNPVWEQMLTADAVSLAGTHDLFAMNAVGEGQVNVCGEGGNIEAGDLIVTSSTSGKGMRQADDLVRSYTVARSREAVTFASPDEVKMIACIYLSG